MRIQLALALVAIMAAQTDAKIQLKKDGHLGHKVKNFAQEKTDKVSGFVDEHVSKDDQKKIKDFAKDKVKDKVVDAVAVTVFGPEAVIAVEVAKMIDYEKVAKNITEKV